MFSVRFEFMVSLAIVLLSTACSVDGSNTTGDGNMVADAGLPPIETPACADERIEGDLPIELSVNTSELADKAGPAPCVAQGTDGSSDFTVFFVAPRDGDYRISTAGSAIDTVLHASTDDCLGQSLGCNDDYGDLTSELTLTLSRADAVVISVEAFNRETGAVILRIEGREEVCDDGVDDDGDGAFDCEDLDCFLTCEDPYDWPVDWVSFETGVLDETNRRRAEGYTCGAYMNFPEEAFPPVHALEMNEFLRYSSRLHARDMGLNDYFEHTSQDGRTPTERMRMVGFEGPGPTGENIAAGQPTPEDVVESWMTSPGHCRNIMSADYHVLGVGYAQVEGSGFGHYWVQNFGGGH